MDDGFPDHEKVDSLSDGAFRLHVSALAYCARKLTDGCVPRSRPSRLVPNYKPGHLKELLRDGLWHVGGEGCGTEHCPTGEPHEYVLHDYLEWNKSRDWWTERRRKEAERIAEWRAKKSGRNEEGAA